MKLEWDSAKAAANLKKHGVDFADAAVALEDENALTIEDSSYDEQRFKSLAMGPNLMILMIVHTAPDTETVRIVSARKADPTETMCYYQGIGHE